MNLNRLTAKFEWSDVLPWLVIFRSLTTTFSVSVLVFALLGVVATPVGWIISENIFINSPEFLDNDPVLAELAELNRSPYQGVFLATKSKRHKLNLLGVDLSGPRLVFEQMVKPFYAIFGGESTARETMYYLTGAIWSLLVWSFAGLGISRVCLLRFTRNERAGLDDAFEYATKYFSTTFSALALPFALVVLLCIPTFLIGLLLGFDAGVLLVGVVWFVVLGLSLMLGVLLLGMMVSWPLVVASVAAEGQNSFDAVTRAFAYAFQRPVHYFFYVLVAVIFGGICWLIVLQFTESVIRLSFWSTALGANQTSVNRMDSVKGEFSSYSDFFLKSRMISGSDEPTKNSISGNEDDSDADASAKTPTDSRSLKYGRQLISFWTGMARTMAAAFIHGLFWCMASAIYLLLRRDVDQTEMDEIFVIDERRTYDLPPLKSDENGIPQVQPLSMDEDRDS